MTTYYIIDFGKYKESDITDDNIVLKFPIKTLNNINEGLPSHEFCLKENAIVMLIRDISITDGLDNGTR